MNTKFVFLLLLLCLPNSLPLCAAVSINFAPITALIKPFINRISTSTKSFIDRKHLKEAIRIGKKTCKAWKISQNSQTCISLGNDTNKSPSDSKVDISVGTYPQNYQVGSNRQSVYLIPDISLDLTFMMCDLSEAATKDHVYQKNKSFSFISPCSSKENCPYNFSYTSPYVTSAGYMSSDIFYLFKNGYSHRINFGCGYKNTGNYGNSIGYIGLGLNSSFLKQLKVRKFSYCLNSPSGNNFKFGSSSQLTSASGGSTKFLSTKNNQLSYYNKASYYITLTGITVGTTPITILSTGSPPKPDGTGVMALSSTSPITYLETKAYNEAKNAIIKQMGLQQVDTHKFELDLCFSNTQVQEVPIIPQLTLHFDGADMNISRYFWMNKNKTLYCLMMLPQDDGPSILGSYMQMDMHMIYDIGKKELQFERYDDCRSHA